MATKTSRIRLPNGLWAYQDDPKTTKVVYSHITDYLDHEPIRLHEGMTVFDVGANTGLFALEVLHRCNGQVRLFCFEPAPSVYQLLDQNIREQFPGTSVKTYCCGLSSEPGNAILYYRPHASFVSSIKKNIIDNDAELELWTDLAKDPNLPTEYREIIPRWIRFLPRFLVKRGVAMAHRATLRTVVELPCELKTISQIVKEEGVGEINLLKIDVEGAELDVLLGIEARDWGKIKALVMEVHDEGGRLESIRNLLNRYGKWEMRIDQDYVFRGRNLFNLYASRQGN